MTLQELAKEALGYFELRERVDKRVVYAFKKNTPDWVRELVYEAFPQFLPDDFIFKNVYHILDQLSKGESVSLGSDIYQKELKDWAFSSVYRIALCDSVLIDQGGRLKSVNELFRVAQQEELTEIQQTIISGLAERLEIENEHPK